MENVTVVMKTTVLKSVYTRKWIATATKKGHLRCCCQSKQQKQSGCKLPTTRKPTHSRANSKYYQPTHYLESTDTKTHTELPRFYTLFPFNKNAGKDKPYHISIDINDNKITMEVDTGATIQSQ